jgi:alkylhydroperoxidase/carboxymuconolactone decarboxylase family protein YurZ
MSASSPNEAAKTTDETSPEAVLARAVAARGDIYPEWRHVIEAMPQLFERIQATGGYFHKYKGKAAAGEELSPEMRELIATAALAAKPDVRYGANHVRKMYRMGLTNRVIFEAASVFACVSGFSTVAHAAEAVMVANSSDYTFGKLPDGGAPAVLTPFPELTMGRVRKGSGSESLLNAPEWQFASELEAEFARRATGWVDYALLADGAGEADALLGTGPRELIMIAALCVRGEVEMAADHILRAYDYGMTRGQVLDAIISVLPMTGIVTAQLGLRAIKLAEERKTR